MAEAGQRLDEQLALVGAQLAIGVDDAFEGAGHVISLQAGAGNITDLGLLVCDTVRLDGGLGVGEEVLELLEDLAGGRGRAGGRGACGEERRARVSTSDDLDLP